MSSGCWGRPVMAISIGDRGKLTQADMRLKAGGE
jgi:hypothetical protein